MAVFSCFENLFKAEQRFIMTPKHTRSEGAVVLLAGAMPLPLALVIFVLKRRVPSPSLPVVPPLTVRSRCARCSSCCWCCWCCCCCWAWCPSDVRRALFFCPNLTPPTDITRRRKMTTRFCMLAIAQNTQSSQVERKAGPSCPQTRATLVQNVAAVCRHFLKEFLIFCVDT